MLVKFVDVCLGCRLPEFDDGILLIGVLHVLFVICCDFSFACVVACCVTCNECCDIMIDCGFVGFLICLFGFIGCLLNFVEFAFDFRLLFSLFCL